MVPKLRHRHSLILRHSAFYSYLNIRAFLYKYIKYSLRLSRDREMDFLAFRFWVGVWITLILFLFVALDLSALVRYITRFTEESFATLISIIFIYEAFKKVGQIWTSNPVGVYWDEGLDCYCRPLPEGSPIPTTGPNGSEIDVLYFSNFSSGISDDCINHKVRIISRNTFSKCLITHIMYYLRTLHIAFCTNPLSCNKIWKKLIFIIVIIINGTFQNDYSGSPLPNNICLVF